MKLLLGVVKRSIKAKVLCGVLFRVLGKSKSEANVFVCEVNECLHSSSCMHNVQFQILTFCFFPEEFLGQDLLQVAQNAYCKVISGEPHPTQRQGAENE